MKVKVTTPFYSTETGLAKPGDILEIGSICAFSGLVKEIPEEPETKAAVKKETKKAKQA